MLSLEEGVSGCQNMSTVISQPQVPSQFGHFRTGLVTHLLLSSLFLL